MADKTISELTAATQITASDMFVLEQSGTAKKLTGQILENWLVSYADGHGGIQSIVYTAPVSPSLVGTIDITMADETVVSLPLSNGRGVTSFAKTATSGLVDTYTMTFNDGTSTTLTVSNGAKGDTGDADYVYIKYAGQQPSSDADMGDTPDNWMGIAVTTDTTAPTHYTDYDWYRVRGDTGATGATGETGNGIASIAYTGGGTAGQPGATDQYTVTYTDGTTFNFNVYNGQDGQGSPSNVDPEPLGTASSGTAATYSRSDHVHPYPTDLQIKSFTSVEQLGITVGSATISGTWSAMPDGSILIAQRTDFPSSELPGDFAGEVEIIKNVNGVVGAVAFHGKTISQGDYRMFLDSSGVPDGTWRPVTNRPYATARMTSTQTISVSTAVVVNLSTILDGSGFTLSSNKLIVPAGVNHVLVSASAYFTTTYTSDPLSVYIHVVTNGTDQSYRNIRRYNANYESWPLSARVFAVEEGTEIYMTVQTNSGTVNLSSDTTGTFLSVVAID